MNYKWKNAIVSGIGIIVIALGVALIVKANIGIDPWGVFFNATQMTYMAFRPEWLPAISFGDSITIISFVIVISASLLIKEKIKWLSIVGGILLGQCVNIWAYLLQFVNIPVIELHLGSISINTVSFVFLVIGILILSFGVAITIHFPFIMTPVDYLMYAIDLKVPQIAYGIIRVISDITMTTIGALLILILTQDFSKTRVGIGTIILFFITGLVIDFIQKRIGQYLKARQINTFGN